MRMDGNNAQKSAFWRLSAFEMMNLESVSLKSALPGTNLVAPFFVISNVLRTAKPLFFLISNAPGPCAGRRFGPLLGGGGGGGAAGPRGGGGENNRTPGGPVR